MQAVLYIAHGSRVQAGIEEAIDFIESVKPRINVGIQEICFLELAEPSIQEGVAACVAQGATNIAVIPILLLTANHAKKDIPLEIHQARKVYPHVSFTFGKPFGFHDKLIGSLYDRVQQKNTKPNSEVDVLLIGRGSSDKSVQTDFREIADVFKRQYHFAEVDICFLYGKGPSFEDAIQQLGCQRRHPVYIIPYILFTGLLKMGIQKKIAQQGFSEDEVVLCECLGYDANVSEVLIERVKETLYSNSGIVLNG